MTPLSAALPVLYVPDFAAEWAALLAAALAEAPWLDELGRRVAARIGINPDNCLMNDYPTGAQASRANTGA